MTAFAILIAYCALVGVLATALCVWLVVLMVLDARRVRSGTHAPPPLPAPGSYTGGATGYTGTVEWTTTFPVRSSVIALLAPREATIYEAAERFAARREPVRPGAA